MVMEEISNFNIDIDNKRGNKTIINIDDLPSIKDTKFTEDVNDVSKCCICLETITNKDDNKDDNEYYFNCQHKYHFKCIKDRNNLYMTDSYNYPICRICKSRIKTTTINCINYENSMMNNNKKNGLFLLRILGFIILGYIIFASIYTHNVTQYKLNSNEDGFDFPIFKLDNVKVISNCSCVYNESLNFKYNRYNLQIICNQSEFSNTFIYKHLQNVNYEKFCNIENSLWVNYTNEFKNKLQYCSSTLSTYIIPLFKIDLNEEYESCYFTQSFIQIILILVFMVIYFLLFILWKNKYY
jgi:hypothetical protein